MNRLERLASILIYLQTKRVITGKELAEKYGISLRSVYRDIRALEEAGVPIGAESGKGYFLSEGYSLPPVMFKREEAAALLTGEKIMEKVGDASLGSHFCSAMNKIRSVLKHSEKDYLESLDESISVQRVTPQIEKQFQNAFINDILNAIAAQKMLEIEYFSYYNEEHSNREVEPLGICLWSNNWHMIAWCNLRNDYRDFRIDRISKLRPLEKKFDKRNRETLDKYLSKYTSSENLQKFTIDFNARQAKYMYEQKFYYGLVDECKVGEKVRMTFVNSSLEYFGRWLLIWGNAVDIIEPESLKTYMKCLANELHQHYN